MAGAKQEERLLTRLRLHLGGGQLAGSQARFRRRAPVQQLRALESDLCLQPSHAGGQLGDLLFLGLACLPARASAGRMAFSSGRQPAHTWAAWSSAREGQGVPVAQGSLQLAAQRLDLRVLGQAALAGPGCSSLRTHVPLTCEEQASVSALKGGCPQEHVPAPPAAPAARCPLGLPGQPPPRGTWPCSAPRRVGMSKVADMLLAQPLSRKQAAGSRRVHIVINSEETKATRQLYCQSRSKEARTHRPPSRPQTVQRPRAASRPTDPARPSARPSGRPAAPRGLP